MLWELRTISVRFALGIATTDDLVDVSHRALDNGIYAHSLGEIVTSRNPSWYDLVPHFEFAMRELEIAIPDWDRSIDILAQSYMVPLSEELLRPRDAAERIYEDYNGVFFRRDLTRSREVGSAGPLGDMYEWYHTYDYLPYTVQQPGEAMDVAFDRVDSEFIAFARKWCRDRWRASIDPDWLTSDVLAMCRGMYESRDFSAMPLLADALQEAGCENADVLEHCRGPGPHVRGCWVVDLLLGKE